MKKLYLLIKIELNALVRDTNWFVSQLINPILLIGVFTFLIPFLISGFTDSNNLISTIAVSGKKHSFIEEKLTLYGFDIRRSDDALKTVINKQTDIGIKILKSDIKNINLGEIEIYLLGSNIKSGISYQKLKQALNEITLAKVAEFANIESNLLARINPTPINVESTKQAAAGAFAFLIPILVFNFLFATAQGIGVDLTAGSRERGELTAQLSTPSSKYLLFLQRVMVTCLFCVIQALWMVMWFLILTYIRGKILQNGFVVSRGIELGTGSFVSLQNFAVFSLIAVFTAFAFSSIVTAVSISSKTVRSANGWLGPIGLFITICGVIFQFSDFIGRPIYLYIFPIIGSVISLLDAIKGDLNVSHATLNCLSSALITVLCVFWGARKIGC
jgi:ABC-type Na+ efflux pump permease subunit